MPSMRAELNSVNSTSAVLVARRESPARLPSGKVAIGVCSSLALRTAIERLRGHGALAALGKNLFDLGVRAGDDVYGYQLADAPRRRGPGVCGRLHRADVA